MKEKTEEHYIIKLILPNLNQKIIIIENKNKKTVLHYSIKSLY
jgi:hypothetical protein